MGGGKRTRGEQSDAHAPKKEAKKSEEEPEAEEPKEDDKAAKKAAYWAKQAAFWAKKAEEEEAKKDEKPEADKEEGKKAGEDEPDGDEPEADKEEGKKKAGQNDPGYFAGELDPEEEAMLASMLAEEEAPVVADDVLMDDAEDPMGFMDSDDGMSDDDMSAIYGSKAAGELPPALQKINDEKAEKAEKEEKKAAPAAAPAGSTDPRPSVSPVRVSRRPPWGYPRGAPARAGNCRRAAPYGSRATPP